jgi:hypothetical protein
LLAEHPQHFAAKRLAYEAKNLGRSVSYQIEREIYGRRHAIVSSDPAIEIDASDRMLFFAETDGASDTDIPRTPPPLPAALNPERPRQVGDDEGETPGVELAEVIQTFFLERESVVTKRIREQTSSNRRGRHGNKWLHPDLVGMHAPGRDWLEVVRRCSMELPTRKAKLIAVEVKRALATNDVRQYFFQTVSNSTWANRAYLAACEIRGEDTWRELETLCIVAAREALPARPTASPGDASRDRHPWLNHNPDVYSGRAKLIRLPSLRPTMSQSVVRLTMYSLLSALETDLRRLVRTYLLPNTESDLFSPEQLGVLKKRASRDADDDASDLLDYLDYADTVKLLNTGIAFLPETCRRLSKMLNKQSSALCSIRNRVMHSRPLHYSDYSFSIDIINSILTYPRHLFPSLHAEESRIKRDPTSVLSVTLPNHSGFGASESHNLPLPDFDETGFLGRADECKRLLTALRGPWPVVTIVGEGGVGKTALALRVAYELLDDSSAGFDAIVWTSSKTTRLTVTGIQNIECAIEDSLGIFSDIQGILARESARDSVGEVVKYQNSFKILLILDNLETILDQRVRVFLSRLTGASKVLITSRVGLGEMEYRFVLTSLPVADAVDLLRATAKVRHIPSIAKVRSETLKAYCQRMKNKSAFIKWFVTAVQVGKQPEEILQNAAVFLDYCMPNVWGYLDASAKAVADALLAVPGKHA